MSVVGVPAVGAESGTTSHPPLLRTRPSRRALTIGLALWALGLLGGFVAQLQLHPDDKSGVGWRLFGFAALFVYAGATLIDQDVPLSAEGAEVAPVQPVVRSQRRLWLGRRVLWAGAGLTLGSVVLGPIAGWLYLADCLWLVGLGALVAGAVMVDAVPFVTSRDRLGRSRRSEWLVLGGILLLALALRLPNLAQIPPEVHGDEAAIGVQARDILSGKVQNLFGVGWYDVPILSFAIPAATMVLFGNDLFGLRMASVLQGMACIALLYLLARRLFGSRIALVATVLLTVAQWHIHFSRTGFHYMQAELATLMVLYFLVRGLQDRRLADFVLAGIGVGVCFTVYYAARLAPAVALLFVAYCALRQRDFLQVHLRRLAIIPAVAFLFLAPTLLTFMDHPSAFMSRTSEVSLLSQGALNHELDAYRVSTLNDVLYIQAKNTLTAFNLTGETSLQYQHKDALLDFWTGSLLVLGVLLLALRLDEPRHLLFGGWIVATLLAGSVLTVDAPFSPRLIGVIPPLMLPPALVLDAGWRGASRLLRRRGRLLMALLTAAILGLSTLANYRDYFITHVTKLQPAGYYTTLAHFIEPLNSRYRVYYLNEDGHPADYFTITFLLPNLDAVADHQSPLHVPLRLDTLPGDKGALFIVDTHIPDFDTRLAQIVRAYPAGQKQTVSVVGGGDIFVAYQVEPDTLRAVAQP